jgi:hypothetical protein
MEPLMNANKLGMVSINQVVCRSGIMRISANGVYVHSFFGCFRLAFRPQPE